MSKKWSMTHKWTQPYPTYSWGLYPNQSVYENKSMMDAIESALENMDRFPDAEKIIRKIQNGVSE